jgi:hypothetical protein
MVTYALPENRLLFLGFARDHLGFGKLYEKLLVKLHP